MSTLQSLIRFKRKLFLKKINLLYFKPQQGGICLRSFIRSPKKPNSAKRKIVIIAFQRKKGIWTVRNQTVRKLQVQCYIPGIGTKVQQHSNVIFRGGRLQDVPGVRFHLICGKMDVPAPLTRKRSRSKYGVKIIRN